MSCLERGDESAAVLFGGMASVIYDFGSSTKKKMLFTIFVVWAALWNAVIFTKFVLLVCRCVCLEVGEVSLGWKPEIASDTWSFVASLGLVETLNRMIRKRILK